MYCLPTRDERRCSTCGVPRDMLQPDEREPGRLLLVCPRCHGWSVLVGSVGSGGSMAWESRAGLFGRAVAAVESA